MCLGLPAQIVDTTHVAEHRAIAEVSGVRREVNVGLIVTDGETLEKGDWVLVHVGFALSKIDEDEAARTLEFVRELGSVYDDELTQFGD